MNRVFRLAYRGVALPFRAGRRMLYQGARGIVSACAAVKNGATSGVRSMGRGILRTVRGIGAAIASVFAIFSPNRIFLKFLRPALKMMNSGLVKAATQVAMPFAVIYRMPSRIGSLIGARYRSLVFNMGSTAMTLSIEDGYARLLVLKGDRVIAWRKGQIARADERAPYRTISAEAGKDIPQTVLNPLQSLFDDLPARSKRVVADLPLHVPLLRHVPIPEVKRRYLKDIVNNEVLDSVPFSADEMDIQWRIAGDDHKEASVVAVPRERMDEQAAIVRDSQLAQSAVYTKAAALAAAVARPDVFILHMAQGQASVILVRGGVTRIVHRLELPEDTTEQAEAIAMGVGQVAGYHRSQRPEDNVASLPVVVTGEIEPVKDLVALLATHLDRPLLPFEPQLEFPEGFNPAEYASNIGLFVASRSKESTRVIAAQNVLPERYRPWQPPVAAMAVFAGLIAMGFLSFNVTGLVSGVAGELDPLNSRLEAMEEQAREYRQTAARQRIFDKGIADADQEVLELETNLLALDQEMNTLLARINDITKNAGPSDVELSRIGPAEAGFFMSGLAPSYSDVLGYAASMRSSPNFDDATVMEVSDSGGPQVGFIVVVTVPTPEPDEEEEPAPQAQSP